MAVTPILSDFWPVRLEAPRLARLSRAHHVNEEVAGYTDAARRCLLFEADRNGRTLIGVVLGSPPTGPAAGAQDAAKMLNWGFRLRRTG